MASCHNIDIEKGTTQHMNFKALALAAITSVAGMAFPAQANENNPHVRLLRAVESVGVDVRVNQPKDCDPRYNGGVKAFGWYHGPSRSMVICQEYYMNRGAQFNGSLVRFTEEDLDTLRHEAHHLVQDCMDDRLNQQLSSVYNKPIELAVNTLGADGAREVVRMYSQAPEHVQVMELEAFAVAAMNDPLEQVSDIRRYCF